MKKWICMCLVLCMLMSGSAMAIGRAIPQENVEVKPFYINCFDLVGMSREEVHAYLEENERELRDVQLDYTTYPDENGEMVQMLCGFGDNGGSGFGVYDLSVNLDFDGELNEAMLADGWVITSRQFEGGYWYNRLECPAEEEGHTLYTMFIQTDGSRIMYMEFKVVGMKRHFEKMAAAKAEAAE